MMISILKVYQAFGKKTIIMKHNRAKGSKEEKILFSFIKRFNIKTKKMMEARENIYKTIGAFAI